MTLRVELRRNAGRVSAATGPWIRKRQVSRTLGPADAKAMAELLDHRGDTLGFGLFSPVSDIVLRMITWGEQPPPEDWLARRIRAALEARDALGFEAHRTTGYREINSEGDGLPGLTLDRYGDDRVLSLTTAAMAAREKQILAELAAAGRPIHLIVPATAARHEGMDPEIRNANDSESLRFSEYGVMFQVPAPPSQKTGGYLDQRRNRRIVAQLAARHGGRLLDVGCHVGGFGVHAATLGVPAVLLDRSRVMLDLARRNARENGVLDKITVVETDMFRPLDHPDLDGPFAVVVVDPPKMAASRRDRDRALAALSALVSQSMNKVAPTGHLVLCSCSHHIDRTHLDATVTRAGHGLWTRTMELGHGPDHPVWPGHAEGEYLRVNIYQRRGQ